MSCGGDLYPEHPSLFSSLVAKTKQNFGWRTSWKNNKVACLWRGGETYSRTDTRTPRTPLAGLQQGKAHVAVRYQTREHPAEITTKNRAPRREHVSRTADGQTRAA